MIAVGGALRKLRSAVMTDEHLKTRKVARAGSAKKGVTEFRDYSALMPAARMTFAHFSV